MKSREENDHKGLVFGLRIKNRGKLGIAPKGPNTGEEEVEHREEMSVR